jgi:hypothetical protein
VGGLAYWIQTSGGRGCGSSAAGGRKQVYTERNLQTAAEEIFLLNQFRTTETQVWVSFNINILWAIHIISVSDQPGKM